MTRLYERSGQTECLVIEGTTDAETFVAYIQKILVPTLRAQDLVIMDNLSFHKDERVRQAIEGAGAQLRYLPPTPPT